MAQLYREVNMNIGECVCYLEVRYHICVCNNELGYNEGHNTNKFISIV